MFEIVSFTILICMPILIYMISKKPKHKMAVKYVTVLYIVLSLMILYLYLFPNLKYTNISIASYENNRNVVSFTLFNRTFEPVMLTLIFENAMFYSDTEFYQVQINNEPMEGAYEIKGRSSIDVKIIIDNKYLDLSNRSIIIRYNLFREIVKSLKINIDKT